MKSRARRWAVVVAAGRGERFGGSAPKQYRRLLDRCVLSWALKPLLEESSIDGIVVVLAQNDRRFRRLPEARLARVATCVGGDCREVSVTRGLEALASRARPSDWVIVHDAARPCLRHDDLARLIAATRHDTVGGLLATPVADTLKVDDGRGRCVRTATREGLWRALTPQMFRYGLLARALALCLERERAVTDEASAIEALGLRPRLISGRTDNIKLTCAEDLGIIEAILRQGRKQ